MDTDYFMDLFNGMTGPTKPRGMTITIHHKNWKNERSVGKMARAIESHLCVSLADVVRSFIDVAGPIRDALRNKQDIDIRFTVDGGKLTAWVIP